MRLRPDKPARFFLFLLGAGLLLLGGLLLAFLLRGPPHHEVQATTTEQATTAPTTTAPTTTAPATTAPRDDCARSAADDRARSAPDDRARSTAVAGPVTRGRGRAVLGDRRVDGAGPAGAHRVRRA